MQGESARIEVANNISDAVVGGGVKMTSPTKVLPRGKDNLVSNDWLTGTFTYLEIPPLPDSPDLEVRIPLTLVLKFARPTSWFEWKDARTGVTQRPVTSVIRPSPVRSLASKCCSGSSSEQVANVRPDSAPLAATAGRSAAATRT